MKKILLICVGLFLLWATLQVMLEMGGGVTALYRKLEYNWYSFRGIQKHDPGQCARIGDDTSQGNPGYLRENCFYKYMRSHVATRSDCAATHLIVDALSITQMSTTEWFRQECLIEYYKHIF